jgi:hypothetical protein
MTPQGFSVVGRATTKAALSFLNAEQHNIAAGSFYLQSLVNMLVNK